LATTREELAAFSKRFDHKFDLVCPDWLHMIITADEQRQWASLTAITKLPSEGQKFSGVFKRGCKKPRI
jgi:hypothetical protein